MSLNPSTSLNDNNLPSPPERSDVAPASTDATVVPFDPSALRMPAPGLRMREVIEAAGRLLQGDFAAERVTANPAQAQLLLHGRFLSTQRSPPNEVAARVFQATGWRAQFTPEALRTSTVEVTVKGAAERWGKVRLPKDWNALYVKVRADRSVLSRYVPKECFPEGVFRHAVTGEHVVVVRWGIERVDVQGLAAALKLESLHVAYPAGLEERHARSHSILKAVRHGVPRVLQTTSAFPVEMEGFGACETIGGSAFAFRFGDLRVLVDYGMIPDSASPPPLSRDEIRKFDAVVLSHGHTDHAGLLPSLYARRKGGGARDRMPPLLATEDTLIFSKLLQEDAFTVQTFIRGMPAPFKRRDVREVLRHAYATQFDEPVQLSTRVSVSFLHAGHLPGAAMLVFSIDGRPKVLYSGDISLSPTKLLKAARLPEQIDHVVIEATYAGRDHEPRERVYDRFHAAIKRTLDRGGKVLLPAFKAGRSQEVLSLLAENPELGRDRRFPVYLDGGIAAFNDVVLGSIESGADAGIKSSVRRHAGELFGSDGLFQQIHDRDAFINGSEPGIVVSTSGMCEGPAAEYVKAFAGHRGNLIGLLGFQARGSLGWQLQAGKKLVSIDESLVAVNCTIDRFPLSAHADRGELVEGIVGLRPRTVSLIHGEREGIESLARQLRGRLPTVSVFVPQRDQKIALELDDTSQLRAQA